MAKKRKQRSDKELVAISEDLLYEINMLFGSTHCLRVFCASTERDPLRQTICNALVESCGIHARNLLDFLFSTSARQDDVISEDFFDDVIITWRKKRPAKSTLLSTIHKRVAKELAHLTYSRLEVTPTSKRWQFHILAIEIGVVLKTFLQLVPSSRVSNSFSTFIHNTVGADERNSTWHILRCIPPPSLICGPN